MQGKELQWTPVTREDGFLPPRSGLVQKGLFRSFGYPEVLVDTMKGGH